MMVPTDAPEQDDSISDNPASYLAEPPMNMKTPVKEGQELSWTLWPLPGTRLFQTAYVPLVSPLVSEDVWRAEYPAKSSMLLQGQVTYPDGDSRTFMRASCLHWCPESSPLQTHVESPLQWEEPGDLLISALKTPSDEDQEVSTQRRLWSHQLLSSLYWPRVSEKHGQMDLLYCPQGRFKSF